MNCKELIELCNQVIEGDHLDIDNYVAAEKVCGHVLNTVREDDDELITMEWHANNRPGTGEEGLHFSYGGKSYYWQSWGYELPGEFTRGQLRNIISILKGGAS